MKIQATHYNLMAQAIAPMAPEIKKHFSAIVAEGKSPNPAMRTRWDALNATGLMPWICKEVYPYANDDHIDTALRQIMAEIAPECSVK